MKHRHPEAPEQAEKMIKYSRLSLSRIPRDSLKHFEISVPRNIRVAEVRKPINQTTTFNKWIRNLIPEVRGILKILWKRGEISPLPQLFCYMFLDVHVKTWPRISLRDKRLFEISEVEITRVDCNEKNKQTPLWNNRQRRSETEKLLWNKQKSVCNFVFRKLQTIFL